MSELKQVRIVRVEADADKPQVHKTEDSGRQWVGYEVYVLEDGSRHPTDYVADRKKDVVAELASLPRVPAVESYIVFHDDGRATLRMIARLWSADFG